MPLPAGTKLGPYEIVGPIGAGGMGEVYRALDPRLRRCVAIKILSETLAGGDTWKRFEREALAASALSNPHICAVYDVGESNGQPFLVMELLEGKTLRDFTGREPVEPKTVIDLALQIADALDAAHVKGIIHRDIKPGNIMVMSGRHVKVLDFGLAGYVGVNDADQTRTLEALTAAGTLVGTPHYLSPEVLQGKPADARSDLWALGVVLYEMVSGRLPFNGQTMFEVTSAILREDPPPLPASVPSNLRRIVERCLKKQAAERYQTARELRAALEGSFERTVPGRIRRLWGLSAAALLAAGMLVWQFRPGTSAHLTSTGAPASANREANEAFELAMQFQRVQNDIPRAQQALERATTLDPGFAEAKRYHAFNHIIRLVNGFSNDIGLVYQAEQELHQASQLDPNLISLPAAFTAVYLAEGRKELVPAEQLDRVLQRNPSHTDTRLWRAILHLLDGDYSRVKEDLGIVLERESLNGPARMILGETLRMEGDAQGAVREQQRVLLQAPGNVASTFYLSSAYLDGGELEKARSLLEEKRSLFPANYLWRVSWALLLSREGKRSEALQAMDEQTLKFLDVAGLATLRAAEFYAVLGETSTAIEWLEKAVRNGDARVAWFRKDPSLENVRQDPRFRQVTDSIEARKKRR
jgi:tetratricopeptide (TPR) repeat protein